jgi:nucleoside-diphosphate-sugar epimerase
VPLPLAWALAVGSEFVGRLRGVAPIFNRDKVREGGASGWWVDHGRAERELGYSPGLPYREGIASLIDHLRSEGR